MIMQNTTKIILFTEGVLTKTYIIIKTRTKVVHKNVIQHFNKSKLTKQAKFACFTSLRDNMENGVQNLYVSLFIYAVSLYVTHFCVRI